MAICGPLTGTTPDTRAGGTYQFWVDWVSTQAERVAPPEAEGVLDLGALAGYAQMSHSARFC
jgi:hypothetical protein